MSHTLAHKSHTFGAQMCSICGIWRTFCNFFHYPIHFFQPKSNFILIILYPYTSIKIISCKSNQFLVSNYLFLFYTYFTIFTTHLFTSNKNHILILLCIHLISNNSIINCFLFPIHVIC